MPPQISDSSSARVLTSALALSLMGFLGACGGGGGGGSGGGSLTPASFTSWDALPTNTPVVASAMSVTRQANGTIDPADTSASSAGVLYGSRSSTGLRALTFTTPLGSTTWQRSQSEISDSSCSGGLCALSDGAQKLAVFSDPYSANAWSYQSFGVWSTQAGTISAISFGAPTAVGALPTTATATYTGFMQGRYVAAAGDFGGAVPAGTQYGVGASLEANVNFGTREIQLRTFGTAVLRQGHPPPEIPNADFDIDIGPLPVLTYTAGSNTFSGNVGAGTNAMGLSGNVNGRFYGPGGQELGGTMSLTTAGGGALIGSFGAKCTTGTCP